MLWAVIMAGGSGTRFWPESREKNPKQFISLFGRRSLFEQTLDRIAPLIPKSRVVVVTQKSYTGLVRKLGKLSAEQVIGEPVGRNTAPCVVLAARMIQKKDPHAVLAILPSDHQIGKPVLFRKVLGVAAQTASETGMPVTFGIQPDFPHTGYGYLEQEKIFKTASGVKVFRLKQFHEKPNFDRAKKFLASGNFLWNSGMFIWRADEVVRAARVYLPEAAVIADKIADSKGRLLDKLYPAMPNISIDFGLMEKMKGKILSIPADIQWCDLGSWLALKEIWPADKDGNIIQGKVLSVQSSGNVVRAGNKLVALLGVKDLVVVDSGDCLLVCPKESAESIRHVVAALKEKKLTQYL